MFRALSRIGRYDVPIRRLRRLFCNLFAANGNKNNLRHMDSADGALFRAVFSTMIPGKRCNYSNPVLRGLLSVIMKFTVMLRCAEDEAIERAA